MAKNWDDEPPSKAAMPPVTEHDFPPGATKERPKVVPLAKPYKGNGQYAPAPVVEIPVPEGESAFSLVERDMPEPVRLCDPWATEGVNIIAGRPKLGKTTLERQKLAAAVTASDFLDSKFPTPCRAAFLSLEEGELVCRSKFKAGGFSEAALAGIQLFFEWPRGEAGAGLLDRYLTQNPDVRIVCIDSLTKFRTVPDHRTQAFIADYDAINTLHEMSKKHPGVVIDVIHHTRKIKSDDPLDDISGTYGLTAACDSALVMRASADGGATLYVAGRLWNRSESVYSVRRGPNHTWQFIGINLGLTDQQTAAYEIIAAEQFGIGGKELGDKLGITQPSAWYLITQLQEAGVIIKRSGKAYKK